MKRNLLRIFGILFSIVIIASLFLPYGKNGVPLFTFDNTSEIILPILIAVFSVISIVLYIINSHCEFAISTSGAILFFVIIEAVYAISNNTFNDFNTGYYLLAGGSVLLFFNTMLILFTKKQEKTVESNVQNSNATSNYQTNSPVDLINQINNEPVMNNPVDLQPLGMNTNNQVNNPIEFQVPVEQPVMNNPVDLQPLGMNTNNQVNNPIEFQVPVEQPVVNNPIEFQVPVEQPVMNNSVDLQPLGMNYNNPVVSTSLDFQVPLEQNYSEPIVTEADMQTPLSELEPVNDINNPLPEIQFEQMPEYKEPIRPIYERQRDVRPEDNPALQSLVQSNQSVNPVLQQFDQPMSFFNQQPVNTQNVQPENQMPYQSNSNDAGMDIFNNHF